MGITPTGKTAHHDHLIQAGNQLMGVKKQRRLPPATLRQMIILFHLDRWIRSHEMQSPTFRELAAFASCKSVRTVVEHIHSLRRKGLVVHLPREQRTIFLTDAGDKALKKWKVPEHMAYIALC